MFLPSLIIFAVFGAVIASFVGVFVDRINTEQSFLIGRSRCDACNAPLRPTSLVPVLSYFFLRGRAQCCGTRISLIAPLSEISLGGLFVFAYLTLGLVSALPLMFLSLALMLALVLYDLAHQILPPWILGAFVLMATITGFVTAPSSAAFFWEIPTALLITASLALINFLSRGRAMGLADAPFAFGCALLTGPTALTGFVFSFWIGAVIGIIILARRPRGSRMGVEVPFAPFLAAGFLLAYFTQWNLFTFAAALH